MTGSVMVDLGTNSRTSRFDGETDATSAILGDQGGDIEISKIQSHRGLWLTLKDPHTRNSPSELMAAETLSQATILTARKFSSSKALTG